MEEWVGGLWDRWITRAASNRHPAAAVRLETMKKTLGIVFRALGGDAGLQVNGATAERHGARRSWLERMAGSGDRIEPASLDGITLRLPAEIDLFPEMALNRELYVWLALLAAHDVSSDEPWFVRNQRATAVALARFPALGCRYQALVDALLALRPEPANLPKDEAAQERALRHALREPGRMRQLPPLRRAKARPIQPVPLWLHPPPEQAVAASARRHQECERSEAPVQQEQKGHRAERVEAPEDEHGMLLFFRAESLLSWAEYVKVNRSQDDEDETDYGAAAGNMDKLSLTQDEQRIAARVRFNLDLPAAAEDDLPIGDGIPLPEWDWRIERLRPDYCRLQPLVSRQATASPLPEELRQAARRLRAQLATLAPVRRWLNGQPDGEELDLDAWVRSHSAQVAGLGGEGERIFRQQRCQERDLACLLLADLSLSTDAYANDEQRVIDVIRDTLLLFGEALAETGDAFAIHGFSSLKRGNIRFHHLKSFEQPYDAHARGRILDIRPGYYTRLGAAIRHSTALLLKQQRQQRLLLILSDGRPHDLDLYEGRYGIEDTRKSIQEAREQGIRPFCVTIDPDAADYLPYMFGSTGFVVVHRVAELSRRLPILYRQLTSR